MGKIRHYNVDRINRDNCWRKGDSVSFSSHGFLRAGFIAGLTIDGDYIGTFNVESDKPVDDELMPLFLYGKDRRLQHAPLRGNISTARVLLTEKTLWPFKLNPAFGL